MVAHTFLEGLAGFLADDLPAHLTLPFQTEHDTFFPSVTCGCLSLLPALSIGSFWSLRYRETTFNGPRVVSFSPGHFRFRRKREIGFQPPFVLTRALYRAELRHRAPRAEGAREHPAAPRRFWVTPRPPDAPQQTKRRNHPGFGLAEQKTLPCSDFRGDYSFGPTWVMPLKTNQELIPDMCLQENREATTHLGVLFQVHQEDTVLLRIWACF